jgi:secreted trypsin-like serine protease
VRRSLATLIALLATAAPAAAAPIIVGGEETPRAWPFMVYLDQGRHELDLGDNQYCGGSLIAPTWVMTAAHCITDATIDPLITTVVLGRHAKSATSTGERIQAKKIVVNESYASNGDDVALIELESAPKVAGIAPIQVAGPGEEGMWAPGVKATILGWGDTADGGGATDVLKEAQVPIVTDADCGRVYADPSWGWNADIMVCAGFPEGGTDTCQGDSGGPMVVQAPDGSWRQVGITSFGQGCAQAGFPGVYSEAAGTRIRTWIAAHVPGAVHTPVAKPAAAPSPSGEPAPAPKPSGSSAPTAAKPSSQAKPAASKPKHTSKAYKRCVKKAGKSKRKRKACTKAEAKRQKSR